MSLLKKIVIAMNKMLFYVTLLGVIFFTFTTISLLILDIINVMEVFSDGRFLIIVIFTVFVWLVFMFALKSCQTRIIFTKEQIEVYQKNQLVRKVNLDEVSMLYYYPFRLHYILTIYAGALSNGGATVLYYQTTDGWVYELGYIGEKDATELKNHFYPDKMIIHFERKPKKRQTDSPVEEHKAFTPLVFDASHGSGVIENISIINARNIIAQNAIQARFLYLLVILNEMILFILLNQNVIILSLMVKEAIQWMIVAIPFFFLLPLILSILIQKGYDRRKRKRSAYHYYFFELSLKYTLIRTSNHQRLGWGIRA